MNDRIFAALADPTRRQLFEKVAERPQSVGDFLHTQAANG